MKGLVLSVILTVTSPSKQTGPAKSVPYLQAPPPLPIAGGPRQPGQAPARLADGTYQPSSTLTSLAALTALLRQSHGHSPAAFASLSAAAPALASPDAQGQALRGLFEGSATRLPLPGGTSFAGLPPAAGFATLSQRGPLPELGTFQHVIVDVRGSRGGHGDVAAGWLTANDILDRILESGASPRGPPRFTFIMDESGAAILSRMTGAKIKPGKTLRDGAFRFETLKSLPPDLPPGDLYLSLASPTGQLRYRHDLRRGPQDTEYEAQTGIPLSQDAVVITQTVLGNTEDWHKSTPHAEVEVAGRKLRMSTAGLAPGEAGVYLDPVAWSLRGKTRREVEKFLIKRIQDIPRKPTRKALLRIVRGKKLAGARIGLAYGISFQETQSQFMGYLAKLAGEARRSQQSFVWITPSAFWAESVAGKPWAKQVVVLEAEDRIPSRAKPGKVYVVKTKTLPHPVFVGLMAYSQIPPVVAGDGAMSAAITLGRPFVLTQVSYNKANINSLRFRLLPAAREGDVRARLLDDVFGADGPVNLSRAMALQPLAELFWRLAESIPSLTDSLVQAAHAARHALDLTLTLEEAAQLVRDSQLLKDVVLHRAVQGDARARRLLTDLVLSGDRAALADLAPAYAGGGRMSGFIKLFFKMLAPLPGPFHSWTESLVIKHMQKVLGLKTL